MDTGLKYLQTQLAMMKCKKKGRRFLVMLRVHYIYIQVSKDYVEVLG